MKQKAVSTKTWEGIQQPPLPAGHLEVHELVSEAPVRRCSYKLRWLAKTCSLL